MFFETLSERKLVISFCVYLFQGHYVIIDEMLQSPKNPTSAVADPGFPVGSSGC